MYVCVYVCICMCELCVSLCLCLSPSIASLFVLDSLYAHNLVVGQREWWNCNWLILLSLFKVVLQHDPREIFYYVRFKNNNFCWFNQPHNLATQMTCISLIRPPKQRPERFSVTTQYIWKGGFFELRGQLTLTSWGNWSNKTQSVLLKNKLRHEGSSCWPYDRDKSSNH